MASLTSTRRPLILAAAAVAMLLLVATLGVGWYYAGEIESGGFRVDHAVPARDLKVLAIGDGQITLDASASTDGGSRERWKAAGVFGVEDDDGYGQVGEILSVEGTTVVRRYTPLGGTVAPGDYVHMDRDAWPDNPLTASGAPFEEVMIPGPLGGMPAWLVDGDDGRWAIVVHGRTGTRAEGLRMLRPVVDSGMTGLLVSYRNDPDAPQDESGRYGFGLTEWPDVEAAVSYAVGHGADDVVLIGLSMGGAIVTSFMYQSEQAGEVSALVLDAPMLDFGATIDLAGRERSLPGFLTWVAKRVATARNGVDWTALNYLDRSDELNVPVLLIHGDADPTVPVLTSELLAELRPDIVTYSVYAGAEHLGAWNLDRERYEQELRQFLTSVSEPAQAR